MKRFFSTTLVFLLTVLMFQQLEAQSFGAPEIMKGKVVFGGNADLGFARNCFYVGVAPQAGYRLTRNLEVGLRLGYDMDYYYGNYYYGNYFAHYFSGAVYANYEIFSGIYAHVEDEEMCRLVSGHAIETSRLNWYNSVFVGGGYRQYFNETSYTFYSVLYNLSYGVGLNGSYDSPYANPFIIRVGYCKGF